MDFQPTKFVHFLAILLCTACFVLTGCSGSSSSSSTPPPPPPPSNNAPVINGPFSLDVKENEGFTFEVSASDADGDSLTYSLTGADSGMFTIDASGSVALNNPLDYENPQDNGQNNQYDFIISVSDGIAMVSENFTLTVENVSAVYSGETAFNVSENFEFSEQLFDPTETNIQNLTLENNQDSTRFQFSSSDAFLTADPFDFETPEDVDGNNSYEFMISFDDGVEEGAANLTISVLNEGTVDSIEISPSRYVSLFRGESVQVQVYADGDDIEDAQFAILNKPSWILIYNDGIIDISTARHTASTGPQSFTVEVSAPGTEESLTKELIVDPMQEVTILTGTIGPNSPKVENAWRDVSVSSPPGRLSQDYEISYDGALSGTGESYFRFRFDPELTEADADLLSYQILDADILSDNYLVAESENDSKSENLTTSKSTYSQNSSSEACPPNWVDANGDGFEFDETWIENIGEFVFIENREGSRIVNVDLWQDLKSRIRSSTVTRSQLCSSVLRTSNNRTNSQDAEPVLVIHGYVKSRLLGVSNRLGGNGDDGDNEYFGQLPALIEKLELNGREFQPYIFQWRTNANFLQVADELASAIEEINDVTGKKVHIVGHSYGGVLARTVIQSLNENSIKAEDHIASFMSIGSPHSGVFRTEENVDFSDSGNGSIKFPDGRDNIGIFIEACGQLSCFQTGENVLVSNNPIYGLRDKHGYVSYKLAETAKSYPAIPTLVLLGVLSENSFCDGYLHNCSVKLKVTSGDAGDGLITLAGQRFIPDLRFSNPLNNNSEYPTVEERVIGFTKLKVKPLRSFFEPDSEFGPALFEALRGSGRYEDSIPYNFNDVSLGANHTSKFTGRRFLQVLSPFSRRLVGFVRVTRYSEVRIATCPDLNISTCNHPTFVNLVDHLQTNPAGNFNRDSSRYAPATVEVTWEGNEEHDYALEVWSDGRKIRRTEYLKEITNPEIRIPRLKGNPKYYIKLIPTAGAPNKSVVSVKKTLVPITVLPSLSKENANKEPGFSAESSTTDFGNLYSPLGRWNGGTFIDPPASEVRQDLHIEAYDADTGRNISRFSASIVLPSRDVLSETTRDSRITIDLAPGEYLVRVSARGYGELVTTCRGRRTRSSVCAVELQQFRAYTNAANHTIVSLNKHGEPGDGTSSHSSISEDLLVSFNSRVDNIVSGDVNNEADIFVRDLLSGNVRIISMAYDGSPANGDSDKSLISDDGRFVVFESEATNLVEGDTNGVEDIFIASRRGGYIERISINSSGEQGILDFDLEDMSDNGRKILIMTASPEFRESTSDCTRLYVVDLDEDKIIPVTCGPFGAISGNGRYVAFHTLEELDGDNDNDYDSFIMDLRDGDIVKIEPDGEDVGDNLFVEDIDRTGDTIIVSTKAREPLGIPNPDRALQILLVDRSSMNSDPVSRTASGGFGNDDSNNARVSDDGLRVVFDSEASNLDPRDKNTNASKFQNDDIYLYDDGRKNDDPGSSVQLISVGVDGKEANQNAREPQISGDGEVITFFSAATNLSREDTQERRQVWAVDVD